MNGARLRSAPRGLKGKVLVLMATVAVAAAAPAANARFGGGGFRGGGFSGFRGGGGFHGFGGDGFGGGRFGDGESHGGWFGGGGGLFGGGGSHHGLFGGGGSHSTGDEDFGQHSSSGGNSWRPPGWELRNCWRVASERRQRLPDVPRQSANRATRSVQRGEYSAEQPV